MKRFIVILLGMAMAANVAFAGLMPSIELSGTGVVVSATKPGQIASITTIHSGRVSSTNVAAFNVSATTSDITTLRAGAVSATGSVSITGTVYSGGLLTASSGVSTTSIRTLSSINGVSITTSNITLLSAMNQSVSSTASPTFAGLTSTGSTALGGSFTPSATLHISGSEILTGSLGVGLTRTPVTAIEVSGQVSASNIILAGTTSTVSTANISGVGGTLRIGPYNGGYLNFFSNTVEFSQALRGGTYGAEIKSAYQGSLTSPTYGFRDAPFIGIGGLMNATSGTLSLITSNTARVAISDDGKVGIGTTAPTYTLDMPNESTARIGDIYFGRQFSHSYVSGPGFRIGDANGGAANYFSQNLSIGKTSAASAALEVSGTMYVTSATVTGLSGSGNGFVCVDSTGKLYRSASACI